MEYLCKFNIPEIYWEVFMFFKGTVLTGLGIQRLK